MYDYNATLVKVVDGDTLDFDDNIPHGTIELRNQPNTTHNNLEQRLINTVNQYNHHIESY